MGLGWFKTVWIPSATLGNRLQFQVPLDWQVQTMLIDVSCKLLDLLPLLPTSPFPFPPNDISPSSRGLRFWKPEVLRKETLEVNTCGRGPKNAPELASIDSIVFLPKPEKGPCNALHPSNHCPVIGLAASVCMYAFRMHLGQKQKRKRTSPSQSVFFEVEGPHGTRLFNVFHTLLAGQKRHHRHPSFLFE